MLFSRVQNQALRIYNDNNYGIQTLFFVSIISGILALKLPAIIYYIIMVVHGTCSHLIMCLLTHHLHAPLRYALSSSTESTCDQQYYILCSFVENSGESVVRASTSTV